MSRASAATGRPGRRSLYATGGSLYRDRGRHGEALLDCAGMIDRALRLTFRNYWTLFFTVAALTVPLQVAYATIWHNVIAVRELQSRIEAFPPLRQVHGVGRAQLHEARVAFWVIVAIEIALLPVLVRAARRILEVDAAGGVTQIADAWRGAFARGGSILKGLSRPGPLITGAAIAVIVGTLVLGGGRLLVEPIGDERAFAGIGLVDGVARAAGAPFFLVVAALASMRPGTGAPPRGAPANSPAGL